VSSIIQLPLFEALSAKLLASVSCFFIHKFTIGGKMVLQAGRKDPPVGADRVELRPMVPVELTEDQVHRLAERKTSAAVPLINLVLAENRKLLVEPDASKKPPQDPVVSDIGDQ